MNITKQEKEVMTALLDYQKELNSEHPARSEKNSNKGWHLLNDIHMKTKTIHMSNLPKTLKSLRKKGIADRKIVEYTDKKHRQSKLSLYRLRHTKGAFESTLLMALDENIVDFVESDYFKDNIRLFGNRLKELNINLSPAARLGAVAVPEKEYESDGFSNLHLKGAFKLAKWLAINCPSLIKWLFTSCEEDRYELTTNVMKRFDKNFEENTNDVIDMLARIFSTYDLLNNNITLSEEEFASIWEGSKLSRYLTIIGGIHVEHR